MWGIERQCDLCDTLYLHKKRIKGNKIMRNFFKKNTLALDQFKRIKGSHPLSENKVEIVQIKKSYPDSKQGRPF